MTRVFLAILVLALVTLACGQPVIPTPTPTVSPTLAPAITPTPAVTVTATATYLPTITLTPEPTIGCVGCSRRLPLETPKP